MFNYGAGQFQAQPAQRDAVVAVVPDGAGILSDDFYVAAASNAAVIFTNPEFLQAELQRTGLNAYLAGLSSVSELALLERMKRIDALRMQGAAIVLLCVTLAASLVVLTSVYLSRDRRRIFVQLIHGVPFLAVHANYLALLLCLAGGTLAVTSVLGLVSSFASFAACATGSLCLVATVAVLMLKYRKPAVDGLVKN